MAEIFGTVAGSLSLAALLSNCVDCFEYIQLGRHFGHDFERCQLRLDVARVRLSRWGEATDMTTNSRSATQTTGERSTEMAKMILEEIVRLFQSAYRTSKRYEINANQQDLIPFRDEDLGPIARTLHSRFTDLASRRQERTSIIKKTVWVLHDGKTLERFISQITDLIDDLYELFPIIDISTRLAEIEVGEINDGPTLEALLDAAEGIDPSLSDAASRKMDTIAGRNSAQEVRMEGSSRFQLGNQYSDKYQAGKVEIRERTINSAGTVMGRGEARIQIGNRFGGRGVLDD
ncbi:putative a chain of the het-s n-terminal domain protein [Phaeoacremonium minimum UCRPA7]|uniref:Putative a chain of the het-s n-terminal domain protein n=1 Tax=Phaeoacremonium minimum (strain UCR-PA7) TaxID=1286976 RepID=R8BQJ2_PHAM7|nr:putative a chain of the het-s n-terminal domain protein [Phaeoacremonium minimum UCRPA7]EOO01594.1 putative a chain of the het-s n-terminal domain protein [Phaeoacremonium minimum UCRPA7]